MKHSFSIALVLLLSVGYAQAADETPIAIELKEHPDPVLFATFSPNGKKVLTTDARNTIRIWDALSGKELKKWDLPAAISMPTVFSPDGKKIVTILEGRNVRIWDAESGKNLLNFNLPGNIPDFFQTVIFSPDGKKILVQGDNNTVLIRDADSGKELKKLEGHTSEVFISFSPDGKRIVTSSDENQTIRLWDADSGKELKKLEDTEPALAWFAPDGKKIILAEGEAVRIWDADLEKELRRLEVPSHLYGPVAFSPDGKRIITIEKDKAVRLWDADSGKELKNLFELTEPVFGVFFLPDGKKIVTVGMDDTLDTWTARKNIILRIWDADSGKELQQLGLGMWEEESMYFLLTMTMCPFLSPDGKRVILIVRGDEEGKNVVRIVDWERLPPPRVRATIEDF